MQEFLKFIFGIKLYFWNITTCFGQFLCFSLYTQQWYMSYMFADSSKHAWHIPLLCVQWKTPDDGQRNCPKINEKLVLLVDFIIRIYHDARSPERQ